MQPTDDLDLIESHGTARVALCNAFYAEYTLLVARYNAMAEGLVDGMGHPLPDLNDFLVEYNPFGTYPGEEDLKRAAEHPLVRTSLGGNLRHTHKIADAMDANGREGDTITLLLPTATKSHLAMTAFEWRKYRDGSGEGWCVAADTTPHPDTANQS
jgi:hypothetical protein